jgi:SAM-dependent methyltransferase
MTVASDRLEAPADIPLGRATMSSELEFASNYHRWNYEWIAPYVKGRILDVGGGTGNHLAFLKDRELVSIDLSPDAVKELRERHRNLRTWSFEVGDITEGALVAKLGAGSFDTVLSCNVFEHIPDDDLAFVRSLELLRPGGNLVLLLPAHGWLFGSMDRLAGHFRRYSIANAKQKLSAAGFDVLALRYVNLVGAVGWFVNNRLVPHRDLSSPSINAQIRVFDRFLIPLLSRLEGTRAMPFGQSLLCVGRKPVTP